MSPIPRTIHESDDVFVQEFYRHPAWGGVMRHLDALALEFKLRAAESTPETIEYHKGRYEGFYEALAAIRTLLGTGLR